MGFYAGLAMQFGRDYNIGENCQYLRCLFSDNSMKNCPISIKYFQERYTSQPCLNETKRWTRFDRMPCIDAVQKHDESYRNSLSCENADCGINTYDFGLGGKITGLV